MTLSIRRRFLVVALLGVAMCAVALVALFRILSVTTGQRLERAREAVSEEVTLLGAADPDAKVRSLGVVGALGLRGGYLAPGEVPPGLEHAWLGAFDDARDRAAKSDSPGYAEVEIDGGVVLLAVAPARGGAIAWTGLSVPDPPYLRTWQLIVGVLAAATLVLVASALAAVATVRRGAASLTSSLAGLARDIEAPIARPPVRELEQVADGISDLARALASSERERERLGAELAQRERLAALGRVVAGVAHEVRNPLASIKLRLDLAVADPGLAASYQREFQRTSEEINRLDRLVRDLLVVAGHRRGSVKIVSLGDLVRGRIDLLGPWASERGVRVIARGDASAELASEEVARAVDNLLKNAIEASQHGAEVGVEIAVSSGQAVVRVCDHGPGVDSSRQSELFEPFFTTKSDGTGLGLAISRSIAAAHGGSLAYSREGAITCFELSLGKAVT